jgi:hypothetical protein
MQIPKDYKVDVLLNMKNNEKMHGQIISQRISKLPDPQREPPKATAAAKFSLCPFMEVQNFPTWQCCESLNNATDFLCIIKTQNTQEPFLRGKRQERTGAYSS